MPLKKRLGSVYVSKRHVSGTIVADPHYFDADSDPACLFDADPYPTFHFATDPEPDPSFQIKTSDLENVQNQTGPYSKQFGLSSAN
jgi:hypothetical protein